MFNHRTDIAECVIRNEIKDWFNQLIIETCGPEVDICYLPNGGHFNTHTLVEISGTEIQINEAIEFIRNTSEIVKYKMAWLNDNTYYVKSQETKKMIENKLKIMLDTDTEINYLCIELNMIGVLLTVFNFRPDLDHTKKVEIENLFKSLGEPATLFITYPKVRPAQTQSSIHMATNILTAFHGQFLSYLSLEDIVSLEMANKGDDLCLDHDIQKFLHNRFPELYEGAKIVKWNLKDFRINDVLRYIIHKYHDRFKQIYISNILTADEIETLSRAYNIEIEYHNIIHIDFKNEHETIEFCAIYHCDPNTSYFLNYDPKYATENYSINFNDDCSLDPLKCSKEFSHFVVKSHKNSSRQKSNMILKYLTEQFTACHGSMLILCEFDLNDVSSEILSSILNMVRENRLQFDTMNFNLTTLIAILGQSNLQHFTVRKCRIATENVEAFSNDSKIRDLFFTDMDLELIVLSVLKNIDFLMVSNCCLLDLCWPISLYTEVSNHVMFEHCRSDVSTILNVLNVLQYVPRIFFVSCVLTPCDNIQVSYLTFRNVIQFTNMVIQIQTLFQIFENCEMQNRIIFENCQFRFESDELVEFALKPVNVEFQHIKFEALALLTILDKLNNESVVWIHDSSILPLHGNTVAANNLIQIEYIQFFKCRMETQTLLNILRKISSKTQCLINKCDLLQSSRVYSNTSYLKKISNLGLWDMKLNTKDLFAILEILKPKSLVDFTRCVITGECVELPKINLQNQITIQFSKMAIETQIVQPLLQTDSVILFDSCCLKFMADEYLPAPIQSYIIFHNTIFDSAAHLRLLANFTPKSKIIFQHCYFNFTNFQIPELVIKPFLIFIYRSVFDLHVLITILEIISEQTQVVIHECDIQPIVQIFSIRPIKITNIRFENMKLELDTILCILKNFTSLSWLGFGNCKILCSNSITGRTNIKLQMAAVSFENMDIDVHIFQKFVQVCTNRVSVHLVNCKIVLAHNKTLSKVPVEIGRLVFDGVKYSRGLLQILQHLNGQFTVEYFGQLSIQDILEICTKSSVTGTRLRLMTQICSKSIYFELFAEYFLTIPLNLKLDTEVEYDLPAFIIPYISSLSCESAYDWSTLKIKFVSVNVATVKQEFFRNGKPIDLFFELNGLSDNSDVCVVDYY